MNLRLKNTCTKLEQNNLDGLLLNSSPNISYLTNFPSRDSYFLLSRNKNIYFTDSRYVEEARAHLEGAGQVKEYNGSVFKVIAEACDELGLKNIGFEERHLAFAEHQKIKKELGKKADLVPTYGLIEGQRQIKDGQEIEKIKKAAQITLKAFRFIKDFIAPGRKEIEVAGQIERFIRYEGARCSAFDIIVASGPNSSFPHHLTSERELKNNEPVLVDIGVDYLGYKSDLTRVFFLGRINSTARGIYDIVLKAKQEAIKQIKPAVGINQVDTAARQYITQKGYGGFFGHNTGHGVGLEVHEEPHISRNETAMLEPGMVFTVEPAIYLPHKFGIRLEDMALVTPKGCEVLKWRSP